jgi:hypothetical protein
MWGSQQAQLLMTPSPTAYRPKAEMVHASASSKDLRQMKLKREVRSLLNKISPENEDEIIFQVCGLHLETEDHDIFPSMVIEKALSDPFYSEVYARAIGKLSSKFCADKLDSPIACGDRIAVGSPWSHNGLCTFAASVLKQCESNFDLLFGNSEQLGDVAGRLDGEETGQKRRAQAKAYMRFLGHLHLAKVVSTETLQHCVHKLLLARSQDRARVQQWWPPKAWIECACELLYTVGKDLSRTEKGRAFLQDAIYHLTVWKEATSTVSGFTRGDAITGGSSGGIPEPAFVYPFRIRILIEDMAEAHRRGWPTLLRKGTAQCGSSAGAPKRLFYIAPKGYHTGQSEHAHAL